MHKEDFRVIKQKGFYKLINGDCLEVMKGIPDKSVDMILCDPPYGTTACKWDTIIPFETLWEQYNRIIKDNGAIVLFSNQPFTTDLINSNRKMWKYEIIWKKNTCTGSLLAKKRPMKQYESLEVFYKKQPTYNPQKIKRTEEELKRLSKKSVKTNGTDIQKFGGMTANRYDNLYKMPSNVIEFDTVFNRSKEKTPHPTQKPVDLLEWLIKTYTNENETILDNCMGSGSTGVACINTNRKFIGIELDEQYFKISCVRVKQALEYKNDYGDW